MNDEFLKVMMNTEVVRLPRQDLATFGTTIVTYNVITRPLYEAIDADKRREESVLRRGTVKAERPKIVTPGYLSRSAGFGSEAQEFLLDLVRRGYADDPGLLYSYSNEPGGMEIIGARPEELAERISADIDRESRSREAVLLGVDELWDVSLMKFIFDLTNRSAPGNMSELMGAGRLDNDDGIPADARMRINSLIQQMQRGEIDPESVHRELEAWQVFEQYEDTFFRALRLRSR